jgi:hypothetical protein
MQCYIESDTGGRNASTMRQYDSGRRDIFYGILIQVGGPMKLVKLIMTCLNGTYITANIGKQLSDNFHIPNGLMLYCYSFSPLL